MAWYPMDKDLSQGKSGELGALGWPAGGKCLEVPEGLLTGTCHCPVSGLVGQSDSV